MGNIYLCGKGIIGKYINYSELKYNGGIVRVYDLLERILKDDRLVKLDLKQCQAKRYFNNKEIIFSNEKENLIYPPNIKYDENDTIVCIDDEAFNLDKLSKEAKKVILITKEKLSMINKINNAQIIVKLEDLNIETFGIKETIKKIYKVILQDYKETKEIIFLGNNKYVHYKDKEFIGYYHNELLNHVLEMDEAFIAGILMDNNILKAIKLRYFSSKLGYCKIEELLKKITQSDIDIESFKITKKEVENKIAFDHLIFDDKAKDKMCYDIIRYGLDALRMYHYRIGDYAIIDEKIINEHNELLKGLNKDKLIIGLVKGQTNPLNYIKEYFKNIYQGDYSLDMIIDIILRDNLDNKRPVFLFNKINNYVSLNQEYIRNNIELKLKRYVFIYILDDENPAMDYILHTPKLDNGIIKAIIVRNFLKEKRPLLFVEDECNICDEVINILCNSHLKYDEQSLIRVLEFTDINAKYLDMKMMPNEATLSRFIEIIKKDDFLECFAKKLAFLDKEDYQKKETLYCQKAQALLNGLEQKMIFFRESKYPMDFSLTEEEINFLAKINYEQTNTGLSFGYLSEKEQLKEKYIIRNLSRIFREMGYEFYAK